MILSSTEVCRSHGVPTQLSLNVSAMSRQIWNVGRKPTVSALSRILDPLSRSPVRFTVRNVTINNAETGVFGVWNWGV